MSEKLGRRMARLEARVWNHRKHQILRSAFAAVAPDRDWAPERVENEVQRSLAGWDRLEPALAAMVKRGARLDELTCYIAAQTGLDVNALLGDAGRR